MLSRPQLGVQKVLFIRVKYPDNNEVILTDQRAPVHAQALGDIIRRNSYDKLNLQIDATPVLMMPKPTSFYRLPNRLAFVRIRADAIKLAADAGFRESDYDREAIFTPKLWAQSFNNVAGFNYRTYFLSIDSTTIAAHETGHTFGWRHASFWRVAGANPMSTQGTLVEYGDRFDLMGDTGAFHHFNPWLKMRAGWLPAESVLTVSAEGTYFVRALEKPPLSGAQPGEYTALRIRRSPNTDYWVFYRSQEAMADVGAIIIQVKPTNTSRSVLLDMTPGSKLLNRDAEDAALAVGQTIRDQQAGIEITTLAKNSDSLTVHVVVPPTPIDVLPVLDVVNPASGQTVRGAVDYEATAYDPDAGATNGAGIDSVRFFLGYTTNEDSSIVLASGLATSPPYIFHMETTTLPDEAYFLTVWAYSANGGANRATFRHIIDNTGPSVPTSVDGAPDGVAQTFQLLQNYPNPFNPSTRILYTLSTAADMELAVYNVAGQKVRTLVHGLQAAGRKSVVWNGLNDRGMAVPSGVYFYQLRAGAGKATNKILLMK